MNFNIRSWGVWPRGLVASFNEIIIWPQPITLKKIAKENENYQVINTQPLKTNETVGFLLEIMTTKSLAKKVKLRIVAFIFNSKALYNVLQCFL